MIFAGIYIVLCGIALAVTLRKLAAETADVSMRIENSIARQRIAALRTIVEKCRDLHPQHAAMDEEAEALITEFQRTHRKATPILLKFLVFLSFAWLSTIAVCVVALPFCWQPGLISLACYLLVGLIVMPALLQRVGLKASKEYRLIIRKMRHATNRMQKELLKMEEELLAS